MKNAVCITVYKNRNTDFISHLGEIKSDYDVYIVAQENDPNLAEYNQYVVNDNINLMILSGVTSIFEKREALRNKMSELEYDGYFQLDDDVVFQQYMITSESKRPTSELYRVLKGDINLSLDKIVAEAVNNDAVFCSPYYWSYAGFQIPGKIRVNKALNCAQFIYLNVKKLDEYNIHYDTSGLINEDEDMILKCLTNGLNCVTVYDYTYKSSNHPFKESNKTTVYNITDVSSEIAYQILAMHNYVRWHMQLQINRYGFLACKTEYHKYFGVGENIPKADKQLLALCEAEDLEGVKAYIRENMPKLNKQKYF